MTSQNQINFNLIIENPIANKKPGRTVCVSALRRLPKVESSTHKMCELEVVS
jgi:hypothetical protein